MSNRECKVFLGGTCADTDWREVVKPMLAIPYFDPVVDDWTEECQKEEERQKEICGIHLYVLTPQMEGVFSVAEIIDSSRTEGVNTVLCVIDNYNGKSFSAKMMKSLMAVVNMATQKGNATIADNLNNVISICNGFADTWSKNI